MLIHGATDIDIHPPVFGGAQRCFGLYRGLARRHAVRVLCMVPNRGAGASEERVDGLDILRRKAWFTALAWRLEQARLSPLFLAERGHRAAAAAALRELADPPDVLMTDLHLAGLRERTAARLRVHHAHNVEADHFRSAGPPLLARGWWAGRLESLESRAVATADLVVAASEEDGERMRSLYGVPSSRVVVAPNGYDETGIRPPTAAARGRARAALGIEGDETVCAFVGSDVPHNRAGLALITERVMPALAGEGFRLLVIGRVARALAGRREPWLIARGETRVLSGLLDAADVGLNPVLAGGGSNIKLPTYLAAGLAVVTTAHGLRGFAPLRPFVTVAEPATMAEALRERPAGWALAAGADAAPPAPVAAYAWGGIGERLGDALAERLACVPPAAGGAPDPAMAREPDARRRRA
jgi:glycosyl transferase family 4/glycosyl transferase family 1